jgi:hypothetical protein
VQAALEMRDFIAERRRRGGAHLGILACIPAPSSRASSARRNSNTTSGETP